MELGILFGFAAMLGWALADIMVVKAVRNTAVIKAIFWSQIISALAYIAITAAFFDFPKISMSLVAIAILTGLLGSIAALAFYKGIEKGKVAVVAPIMACWVVITVILSLVFLNESLSGVQIIAVPLAIFGALLTSFKLKDILGLKFANVAAGAEFAFISAASWGVYFILLDVLVADLGWFIPTLLTRVISALFIICYVQARKEDISFPKNAIHWIIADGFFNLIAFMAYGAAINSQNTSIIAPIISFTPAVTIIIAFFWFKEKIDFNQKIGIVTALSGIVLLSL